MSLNLAKVWNLRKVFQTHLWYIYIENWYNVLFQKFLGVLMLALAAQLGIAAAIICKLWWIHTRRVEI
jgi:hypothetical protein